VPEREEKERLGTGVLRSCGLKTANEPTPHGLKKSNLELLDGGTGRVFVLGVAFYTEGQEGEGKHVAICH
jgi:hypothetical protein